MLRLVLLRHLRFKLLIVLVIKAFLEIVLFLVDGLVPIRHFTLYILVPRQLKQYTLVTLDRRRFSFCTRVMSLELKCNPGVTIKLSHLN